MTACIVGWAHTPFGRLDTGDRRRRPGAPRHEWEQPGGARQQGGLERRPGDGGLD